MKPLPSTLVIYSVSRVSAASSLQTSSLPFKGMSSSVSPQAPVCSSVPFFSPAYPHPTSPKHSEVDASNGLDSQVLKKLLSSVEKIQEVLEKTLLSAGNGDQTDSEFNSFTTAAMSSSSKMSSLSSEPNPFLYSSAGYQSSSSLSSTSYSEMSSGKPWKKSQLRKERICIRFQHDSCQYDGDHPGNSHLCARCYFSKHELLESDHSSDCCQMDLS